MKKFALGVMMSAVAAFGIGASASAQYDTTTTEAGGQIPPTPTTVAPTVATTVAPTTPPGGLPATGSDGVGTTAWVAFGLLAVGGGLFIVSRARRDDAPTS